MANKTRFIGDVHGYKHRLEEILTNLPSDITSVVQIGDMGVGFGQSNEWHKSLDEVLLSVNGRFIRGNHDSPAQCKQMESWIKDGLVENDVMYIGGAWSIDKDYRTPGVSWWEDEELSYREFHDVISIYDFVKPNVMITHDCPLSVSKELFIETGFSLGNIQIETLTGSALEFMFQAHQPKLHIFGHWHHTVDKVINGTRFICLNELHYCDVDMETLEVTFPEYQHRN